MYGGNLDIHHFDAEETEIGRLVETLRSSPLFSSKKLVVIEYFGGSGWDREKFYKTLQEVKDSTENIIILWDRETPEKDVKVVVKYCKKVQEFKIETSAKRSEAEDVNIFWLGDTFLTSPREGLRSLLRLLHQGYDESSIFAYLTNYTRTLLTVRHYLENRKSVPPKHGIHPYVVKKASSLVRAIPSSRIQSIYRRFLKEDYKTKVGISKPKDSLFSLIVNQE